MKLSCIAVAVAVVWGGLFTGPEAQRTTVNADAQVLAEYKKRIDSYMELRRRAQRGLPRLESSEDSAEISSARDALAAAIRNSRGWWCECSGA
jgi:hypothetical protein